MSDIDVFVMVFSRSQLREALEKYRETEAEYADAERIEDFFASNSAKKLYMHNKSYTYGPVG